MIAKPILLMQTGDAPPFILERRGNFDKMFYRAAGLREETTRTVHVRRGEQPDPPERYAAVLVTGSPDMVTDRAPWSEAAAAWLRRAVEAGVPVLAVCYGHQLLAHAFGGRVDYLPGGAEVGTYPVTLTGAGRALPLLADLPDVFPASLAHSQSVLDLPGNAVVLAGSERDPHQMLSYGDKALSLQFHPEFDMATTRACVEFFEKLEPERADFHRGMLERVVETPAAESVLRLFLEAARENGAESGIPIGA